MAMAIKSKLPLELVPAEVEYKRLFDLGSNRSHIGNLSQIIGGISYDVTNNTGQDGMLELLANALKNYMFNVEDYNEIMNVVNSVPTLISTKANQSALDTTNANVTNLQNTVNTINGGQLNGMRFFLTKLINEVPPAGNTTNNDIWFDGYTKTIKLRLASTSTWLPFGYTYQS
jgi:hypothetical protein